MTGSHLLASSAAKTPGQGPNARELHAPYAETVELNEGFRNSFFAEGGGQKVTLKLVYDNWA